MLRLDYCDLQPATFIHVHDVFCADLGGEKLQNSVQKISMYCIFSVLQSYLELTLIRTAVCWQGLARD